jgi:hypothetical protein
MGYFKASLGPRGKPDKELQRKADAASETKTTPEKVSSDSGYFIAKLRPKTPAKLASAENSSAKPPPAKSVQPPLVEIRPCPLCQGPLTVEAGLYRCQGRCKARWIEREAGQLIDLAALPYGICGCCAKPQVLVRGEVGAVCPLSRNEYLLLPDGPILLTEAAPLGLCRCCAPPMPLIERDKQLCCQAKPGHLYDIQDGRPALLTFGPSVVGQQETLAAIDAALRHNSANLTVNGLFDLG